MPEVITMANSEIADDKEFLRKKINYAQLNQLTCLTMVILSRSCHDLAMILASVPCIMISHDLGKGTMVNHDLARLTMIMASVPWLRTLDYSLKELTTCRELAVAAV